MNDALRLDRRPFVGRTSNSRTLECNPWRQARPPLRRRPNPVTVNPTYTIWSLQLSPDTWVDNNHPFWLGHVISNLHQQIDQALWRWVRTSGSRSRLGTCCVAVSSGTLRCCQQGGWNAVRGFRELPVPREFGLRKRDASFSFYPTTSPNKRRLLYPCTTAITPRDPPNQDSCFHTSRRTSVSSSLEPP